MNIHDNSIIAASVISFLNTEIPFNQLVEFKVEHVGGDRVEIILQWDDLQTEVEITQYYQQLPNGSTLDMGGDYLRPRFIASAEVIRKGNKVAVCKMNLHN
ncbi:hypothetical protein [Paraglaciecola sp.]|uniref:hypothetical protein n=1 Tax=Paraglaciecola sp. TaxID=1920173 RepID=UPI0032981080